MHVLKVSNNFLILYYKYAMFIRLKIMQRAIVSILICNCFVDALEGFKHNSGKHRVFRVFTICNSMSRKSLDHKSDSNRAIK